MRFERKAALAAILCLSISPLAAQERNLLAQRLLAHDTVSYSGGAWTGITPDTDHSSSFILMTEAATSVGTDSSDHSALLAVSCLRREPGVSLMFDGTGDVLAPVSEIEFRFPEQSPVSYFGTPLPVADSVGVFRVVAHDLVKDFQEFESVEVHLPSADQSWTFDLGGLSDVLMQLSDDCMFINWKYIDGSFLRLALLELHRQSVRGAPVDDDIQFVTDLINRKTDVTETGVSDYENLQRILGDLARRERNGQ